MTWEQSCEELQTYFEEHGNSNVPAKYGRLGMWVGKIRDDRRRQLKSIGFLWARDERLVWTDKERLRGMVDGAWTNMYNHLVEFHQEHKHCMVSRRLLVKTDGGSSKNLGTWVIRQRVALTDGTLKEDRKQLLDNLSFVWEIDHYDVDRSLRARQWEDMYMKLQAFKKANGHCRIPAIYKDDPTLGKWARNQRSFEKSGRLDETRFERLDVVGFDWNPWGSHWNAMYEKLRAYYERHGHSHVLFTDPDDPALGKWVRNIRAAKAKGNLNDERIGRLNDLEFF
eukprot:scaffold660_cov57-Attheya_sp.AAC.3